MLIINRVVQILLISMSFTSTLMAGSKNEKIELGQACSYFGEAIPDSVYTFSSEAGAEQVIKEIMSVSGLPQNFSIKSAGVPNAAAVVIASQRFILYNQSFMHRMKKQTGSQWAAYSIMAHEIGHHLAGHTLDNFGSRPELELEADKYSGFILQKLGASLNDAQLVMENIGSLNSTVTHPAKHDRLAAISNGWFLSCENDSSCSDFSSNTQPSNSASSEVEQLVLTLSDEDFITWLSGYKKNQTPEQAIIISKRLDDIVKRNGRTLENYDKLSVLYRSEQKKMQSLLNRLGCGAGPEDGIIGQKTQDAVTRFMSYNYIPDVNLISRIQQIERDVLYFRNHGYQTDMESMTDNLRLSIDHVQLYNIAITRYGKNMCR